MSTPVNSDLEARELQAAQSWAVATPGSATESYWRRELGAIRSQAWFEANTSPAHLTDTRTPADVRRQAEAEGWK
jgi:hypothetical protein